MCKVQQMYKRMERKIQLLGSYEDDLIHLRFENKLLFSVNSSFTFCPRDSYTLLFSLSLVHVLRCSVKIRIYDGIVEMPDSCLVLSFCLNVVLDKLFLFDRRKSETVAGQKTTEVTGLKVCVCRLCVACIQTSSISFVALGMK